MISMTLFAIGSHWSKPNKFDIGCNLLDFGPVVRLGSFVLFHPEKPAINEFFLIKTESRRTIIVRTTHHRTIIFDAINTS